MKVSSCHLPDLCSEYFLINFPSKMIFNTKLKIQRRSINNYVQSNLFNTDTKGTEPSVHFTEVSVFWREGMYDFWLFWDQTNCP